MFPRELQKGDPNSTAKNTVAQERIKSGPPQEAIPTKATQRRNPVSAVKLVGWEERNLRLLLPRPG